MQPYVSLAMRQRLVRYATKHDCTESAVVEAALAHYLDGRRDLTLLFRRLDALSRAIERLHRDSRLYGELLNQFVKLWLCSTPRLSGSDGQLA